MFGIMTLRLKGNDAGPIAPIASIGYKMNANKSDHDIESQIWKIGCQLDSELRTIFQKSVKPSKEEIQRQRKRQTLSMEG